MEQSKTHGATRAGALGAALVAGLVLSLLESANGLALRWYHPATYYGLSAGLTLALALASGIVGAVPRVGPASSLWLFSGAVGWLAGGWPMCIALGVAAALPLGSAALRVASPALLGLLAGGGAALSLLSAGQLADRLGLPPGELWVDPACAGVLLAGLYPGLGLIAARMAVRKSSLATAALVLLVFLGLAGRPLLHAPSGKRRLPPPGYAGSTPRVAGDKPPHVFVLVLDTVRADHMTVYGYERDTTPEIARWVDKRPNATAYPRAYANATWTVPSHATLFTGRMPHEHGAHFALDGSVRYTFGIRDELPTLGESMVDGGYAALGTFSNNWLRVVHGMRRGFDRWFLAPNYEPLPLAGEALRRRFLPGLMPEVVKGGARAENVNATLFSMIDPWVEGPNPLFVFANYGDTHGPYTPPPGFRGRFAPADIKEPTEHLSLELDRKRIDVLEARYDEELAYLDSQVGRFLDGLHRRGILDDSWVFITSDHGEAFGEHGVLEHGTTIHDEVVRIPLIVFPPEGVFLPNEPNPVSLVDLAFTVAAIAGVDLEGPGGDLRQEPGPDPVPTTIEFYGDARKALIHGELAKEPARAVLLGPWKLLAWPDRMWLHDVTKDEGENVNMDEVAPDVLRQLEALLPPFGEPTQLEGQGDVPGDARRQLEAWGYVGGE